MDAIIAAVERIRRELNGDVATNFLFYADEGDIHPATRMEFFRNWEGRQDRPTGGREWVQERLLLLSATTSPFKIPTDLAFFLEYYGGMHIRMGKDGFTIFGLGGGEGSIFPSILSGFDGEPRYERGWQEVGDLVIKREPAEGGWRSFDFAMDFAGILHYGGIYTSGINKAGVTAPPIWDAPAESLLCVADSFSAWMDRVASKDWAPFL